MPAGFTYAERMIPFIYTSPTGYTFELKYDKLEREGGKKGSVNEILDSDTAVLQDQGQMSVRFPVDVYFTGDDYDLIADGFFHALSEKYTMLNPGKIIHPRWGHLRVFPMKWKQSESFISGERRANFHIEFVRINPLGGIFKTISLAISQVVGLISFLDSVSVSSYVVTTAQAIQAIGSSINSSIDTVKRFTDDLINLQPDLRDISNAIYLDGKDLLSTPSTSGSLVISQTQKMLKLPMNLEDDTFKKINSFSSIISQLAIDNSNVGDVSAEVRKNKAITFQSIAGFCVAAQNVAALSTNFTTRKSAITAIELLQSSYESFTDSIELFKVESAIIENSFSGDSSFLEYIYNIHSKTISIILQNSFSLASEVSKTISTPIDLVSLCYEFYGSIDDDILNFFIQTNSIKDNEFLELSAGREVVFYV